MHLLALHAADEGGQLPYIADTVGGDWPLVIAELVSVAIVCALLYALAYKPVLATLTQRQEQITKGLLDAERMRVELAQMQVERRQALKQAALEGKQVIDEARVAAARLLTQETQRAETMAEQIVAAAREAAARERERMLLELKHEIGHLVVAATATVAGKVLTPEDDRRLVEDTVRQLAA